MVWHGGRATTDLEVRGDERVVLPHAPLLQLVLVRLLPRVVERGEQQVHHEVDLGVSWCVMVCHGMS